jgi:histidine ammonia-lyase
MAALPTLTLRPGAVTLADLRRIQGGGVLLALDPAACDDIDAARAVVDDIVARDTVVYGVNTGFGLLAQS